MPETYLGKLCKRGHDHEKTGKSRRYANRNCVICTIERASKWASANPEKKRSSDARIYRKNREAILRRAKRRYAEDPSKYIARAKAWAAANPDKLKAAKEKWLQANPEKARAATYRYRAAHPEKVKQFQQKSDLRKALRNLPKRLQPEREALYYLTSALYRAYKEHKK